MANIEISTLNQTSNKSGINLLKSVSLSFIFSISENSNSGLEDCFLA